MGGFYFFSIVTTLRTFKFDFSNIRPSNSSETDEEKEDIEQNIIDINTLLGEEPVN